MDSLTFVSSLIDSLALPLVVLVLGLVFRKNLAELMPAIRRLKAGPLEAEFELSAKEVRASAEAASSKTDAKDGPELAPAGTDNEIVASLLSARSDPAGMILEAWTKIDAELFRLGRQLGDIVDPLTSTTKVYESVLSSKVLPIKTVMLVRELRDLRNKVAHVQVVPTPDAAQDFVLAADRVVQLIHNYRKNLANYRPEAEE